MGKLFQIDVLTIDGNSLPIEDSTIRVEGISGYEREVVPAAVLGDDGEKRKRVPRMIKGKVLFGPDVDMDEVAAIRGAQVVLRDSETNRRLRCSKCSTAKVGELGDGPVDFEMNILGTTQWL